MYSKADSQQRTTVSARPVALFTPLAAIVFSLKNCEGYIRAILIKQLERRSLNKDAGAHLTTM